MIYRKGGMLGDDFTLTQEEKAQVSDLTAQLKTIWGNMGPAAVIGAVSTEWAKLARLMENTVSRGKTFFTTETAQAILNQFYFCIAASAYAPAAYPQVDFAAKYASTIYAITSSVTRVKRAFAYLAQFDPATGEVGKIIRKREQDDMAAGNLDSGFVDISAKNALIRMAYASSTDPRYANIRAKYNVDGTSKTGVEAITQEGRQEAVAQVFAQQEVAQPWAVGEKQESPWAADVSTSAPAAGGKGLVTALVAAAAAFLAFR